MTLPSLLVYVAPRMARMSPPLRAFNEGLLRPRVARAQGTHRAILLPAGGLFQHPAIHPVVDTAASGQTQPIHPALPDTGPAQDHGERRGPAL